MTLPRSIMLGYRRMLFNSLRQLVILLLPLLNSCNDLEIQTNQKNFIKEEEFLNYHQAQRSDLITQIMNAAIISNRLTDSDMGGRVNAGANDCTMPIVYRLIFAFDGPEGGASYNTNLNYAVQLGNYFINQVESAIQTLNNDYLLPNGYSSFFPTQVTSDLVAVPVSRFPTRGMSIIDVVDGIYVISFDSTHLDSVDDITSMNLGFHDDALRIWLFHELTGATPGTTRLGYTDARNGVMALNMTIFDLPFGWETIVHEIGHVLGLDHDANIDNLMSTEPTTRGQRLEEIQLRTMVGHLCGPDPINYFYKYGLPFVNTDSDSNAELCGNGMMDTNEECEINFNSSAGPTQFGGQCVVQAPALPVLSPSYYCAPNCRCLPNIGDPVIDTGPSITPIGHFPPSGGPTGPSTPGRLRPTTPMGCGKITSGPNAGQCAGECEDSDEGEPRECLPVGITDGCDCFVPWDNGPEHIKEATLPF